MLDCRYCGGRYTKHRQATSEQRVDITRKRSGVIVQQPCSRQTDLYEGQGHTMRMYLDRSLLYGAHRLRLAMVKRAWWIGVALVGEMRCGRVRGHLRHRHGPQWATPRHC